MYVKNCSLNQQLIIVLPSSVITLCMKDDSILVQMSLTLSSSLNSTSPDSIGKHALSLVHTYVCIIERSGVPIGGYNSRSLVTWVADDRTRAVEASQFFGFPFLSQTFTPSSSYYWPFDIWHNSLTQAPRDRN